MMNSDERPNVLVFLIDDHGPWASSPYGNREIITPTMQWLADTGVTMNRAYTPCPVCSPARASFWTGRIPSAHGIHDWLHEPAGREPDMQHPGIVDQPHLASLLKQHGYRTGMMGKWHAGGKGQPVDGFDDWFSSLWGTNARFSKQVFCDNGQEVSWQGHQAPRITERAVQFLRQWQGEVPDELYHMRSDPRERINVINEPCAELEALDAELKRYFATYAVTAKDGFDATRINDLFNPNEPWKQNQ